MAQTGIAAKIRPWAEDACSSAGVILWDIEYIKEGGEHYLRIYIDKPEGINITDCEKVARIMNEVLDREDPIEDSYNFQVSSPGIERELKTPEHYRLYVGKDIRINLYKVINDSKEHIGVLSSFTEDEIVLDKSGELITFPIPSVSKVRAYFEF